MILALTGGTGFVGGRTLELALERGHHVRALTRTPQPPRDGVTWVNGALDRPESLDALVAGAEAVVHVAGAVNAPDRTAFAAANIEGTRAIVDAAARAGVRRFVHVSSLAAREPGRSLYGWSKAKAERVVAAFGLDWTIVRPPAVYGPGDLEQLDVFRLAKRGLALLPPPGRMSAIMVDDLAALLLALAERGGPRVVFEPDDGRPMSHADYARAIGRSMGRRVLPVALPAPLLWLGARIDRLLRGGQAKLTPDRARYLAHCDWAADPARRPPPDLWTPRISLEAGMAETARWYASRGLL